MYHIICFVIFILFLLSFSHKRTEYMETQCTSCFEFLHIEAKVC